MLLLRTLRVKAIPAYWQIQGKLDRLLSWCTCTTISGLLVGFHDLVLALILTFTAGIAVSRSGRMFSNYPRALDPNNTAYTVAEIFSNNTERAYPSESFNTPPSGLIDYSKSPEVATGDAEHLIGVQSVVVDPADRLWILDTGRVAVQNGTILSASPGGAKLIGVNLETNQVFKTIVFTSMAAPPDSVGLLCDSPLALI